MVYKCGVEITPHIPVIMQLCLEYLCYDPNYNYDDDDGEDNGDGMDVDDGDEDDDDESDEEYSDDDDMSWKVGNNPRPK